MNLNEKYGVIEFDNQKYQDLIKIACQQLKFDDSTSFSLELFDDVIKEYGNDSSLQFNKISINFNNCISWMKIFNIYFSDNQLLEEIIGGEALSTSLPSILDKNFYKQINENIIEEGSMFLYINKKLEPTIFNEYYLKIIYHEIGHLFDRIHKSEGNGRDKEYYLKNFDFELPDDNCVVENLSISEIYNIIKYALYYTNISERHAFIETANFEMQTNILNHSSLLLNKLDKRNLEFNTTNIFKYSSIVVNDYAFLNDKLNDLKRLSFEKQQLYINNYKNDFKEIFQKTTNYDWLINYLYSHIHHCYINCQKLFLFYYNLDEFKLKINQWKNRKALIEQHIYPYTKSKRRLTWFF